MKRFIIVFVFIVFISGGCGWTCVDVKEYCKKLSYNFKITEKSKGKYIEFKGLDKNNNPVEFKEAVHWNIYEHVEIGDTLYKEFGKAEMILIKKDTTLIFPFRCYD